MAISLTEEFRKFAEWKLKREFGVNYNARNPRWVQPCSQDSLDFPPGSVEIHVPQPESECFVVDKYFGDTNTGFRFKYHLQAIIFEDYPDKPPGLSWAPNYRLLSETPVTF